MIALAGVRPTLWVQICHNRWRSGFFRFSVRPTPPRWDLAELDRGLAL